MMTNNTTSHKVKGAKVYPSTELPWNSGTSSAALGPPSIAPAPPD